MARIGSNGYAFRGYDVSGKRDAQRIANRDAEQHGDFSSSMLEDIATGRTVGHVGPSEAAKNKYRRERGNPARAGRAGGVRRNSGLTKAQKREATRKRAVQRRVAVALSKYLKQVNPGKKLAGAKVEKLKGGVLKITPIKANAGGSEPNLRAGWPSEKVFYGRALKYYGDMEQAEIALADYRTARAGHKRRRTRASSERKRR